MFIAMSLFHFSIFGNTSFSQFSIFGRISPVTVADDDDAVTVADDSSSLVAPWALPRGCFLSRRPFSRGGNLPLLPRFCSACRALAYKTSTSQSVFTAHQHILRYLVPYHGVVDLHKRWDIIKAI